MTGSQKPDRQDADWERYPDTVLHFRSLPKLRIDLRAPLSAQDRAALARIGFAGEFAVITAFDPLGRDLPLEENAQRATKLETRLAELDHSFVRVDACSPGGSHCEASVAVGMPKSKAVRVASEFEQMAIFWYDGGRFWIVGALAISEPRVLPENF